MVNVKVSFAFCLMKILYSKYYAEIVLVYAKAKRAVLFMSCLGVWGWEVRWKQFSQIAANHARFR